VIAKFAVSIKILDKILVVVLSQASLEFKDESVESFSRLD
jgi:hypothetical protein